MNGEELRVTLVLRDRASYRAFVEASECAVERAQRRAVDSSWPWLRPGPFLIRMAITTAIICDHPSLCLPVSNIWAV